MEGFWEGRGGEEGNEGGERTALYRDEEECEMVGSCEGVRKIAACSGGVWFGVIDWRISSGIYVLILSRMFLLSFSAETCKLIVYLFLSYPLILADSKTMPN